MKKIIILFLFSFSVVASAESNLSENKLTGKWLIISSGGIGAKELDMGDDYWTFNNHRFQVETSGKALKPDPYKIVGSNIIYGTKPYEVTIKVISITNTKLVVNTSGIIQTLEKVK